MDYKVEIVNDKINNCFQINLFSFRKKNWWNKVDWCLEYRHIIGHNYMCPEIFRKVITIEEYFEREVSYVLRDYNIVEKHTITIEP